MLHHAVARRIPGPTQPKPNWLRLGHAASRASREEAVVFSIATAMKRARSAEARWCYVALVLQVQRQLELLQGDKEPRLGLQLREQARAKHKAAGGCRRLRGWRSELFEAFCQVLVEDAEKGSSAQAGSGAVSHCSVEFSFSKAPEQRPEAERPARPHTAEVRLTVESPLADPSQSSKPDSSSDAVKQQEVQEESVKLEAAEVLVFQKPLGVWASVMVTSSEGRFGETYQPMASDASRLLFSPFQRRQRRLSPRCVRICQFVIACL